MARPLLLSAALLATASAALACQCDGPDTFCATLDPNTFAPPEMVVMGVKVSQVLHGMEVKVVQVFSGDVQVGDTVLVWGDTGFDCRVYADSWNVGDTAIWGFVETDLMGNNWAGPVEEPGDMMISICGIYYLGYANGIVSGELGAGLTEMELHDFITFMDGCAFTGITEITDAPGFDLLREGDGVTVVFTDADHGAAEVRLLDVAGRTAAQRLTTGTRVHLSMSGLSAGAYVLEVRRDLKRGARRFILE